MSIAFIKQMSNIELLPPLYNACEVQWYNAYVLYTIVLMFPDLWWGLNKVLVLGFLKGK